MDKTKYAPGPWHVGPVDDTMVTDAAGCEVAAVDGDYNDPDLWPVMEANARLIAAAPEMLAELQKQVAWLQHIRPQLMGKVSCTVLDGLSQSVKYMSAAIAKATGQS